MAKHVKLDTVCPANHNLTVTITEEKFETKLKPDELVFHRNTWEANCPPSSQEIAKDGE